ncbi:MAG TPA: acetolactate synthase [Phycisphaerales bacterium]|nr:acetolactate synthase [Phycisphaerales bacterium]HCD34795.1 acetolactate synthase [Phycisphaerales bacterium]|tara:strand:- start:1876 stop:2379 length:504 start_codon:yes stop_codon:yes gene_type:complete
MAEVVTPEATARGFEPPRNIQFSVFLDNRVGKLMELLGALDAVALRIVAMSVVDSADHAVVRILTSRADLARRLLTRNHFVFSETDVLVVQLEPEFSIANLCDALLRAELNIFYAYSLIDHPLDKPALVIHCDDPVLACQILRRRMFTVLGENDLGDNINPGDPSIN